MLYCILATLCWGLWGVFLKRASIGVHPFQVQFFNICFSLLFAPIFLITLKVQNISIEFKNLGWTFLCVVLSVAAITLFLLALQKQKASMVVGITATYPIVTLIVGFLFLNETITLKQTFGILMSVIGVICLI